VTPDSITDTRTCQRDKRKDRITLSFFEPDHRHWRAHFCRRSTGGPTFAQVSALQIVYL